MFSKFPVTIEINGENVSINVPSAHEKSASEFGHRFIETNYQNYLLSEIIQSYAVGDICLIGAKGSGKSILISQIAHTLNQQIGIEPMVLYQDMTARDFVQQRTTTPTGDTVWRYTLWAIRFIVLYFSEIDFFSFFNHFFSFEPAQRFTVD